jgi:hypothetical protein
VPTPASGDAVAPTAAAAPLVVTPVLVSASAPPSPTPSAAASTAATDSEPHVLWLLGCVLLLGALATTLISTSLVNNSVEGKK